MPKPYRLRIILKVLISKGFIFVSQSGSHAKYRKTSDSTLTVIVPIHEKEVRYGTFRSILRQSKLRESDFIKKKKAKIVTEPKESRREIKAGKGKILKSLKDLN